MCSVSTLLEIQRFVVRAETPLQFLLMVSTLLEIQLEMIITLLYNGKREVSTLLEIQRLMCSVLVGF